jgi:hypothetical protein
MQPGRSVFDLSHQRMLFDSIDTDKQNEVLQSLGPPNGNQQQRNNLKQNSTKNRLMMIFLISITSDLQNYLP